MKTSETARTSSSPFLYIRVLAGVAFCVSAYLLYGSLTGERLAGCGPESGCDAVLHSRWAYIFGLPVSLPALLLYAAVLTSTFLCESPKLRRVAEALLVCAAAAIISAAIYFVGLQLLVIGSICKFCMAAHVCGFIAGVLLLKRSASSRTAHADSPVETCFAPRQQRFAQLIVAGLVLTGLMAVGQAVHQPKNFVVQSSAGLSERKAPRVVELHDGLFRIDLSETPVHGSPDATNVMVHLFDYTCSHCRALHPVIQQALHELSNRVAFASLVVPLASNCNRVVQRQHEEQRTACDLAYGALAVWRVNREKLPEFEEFLYSGTKPPLPEAVRARGRELVGTNEFDLALKDPWIQQHLDRNINLYATNYYKFRKQVLPELMIGTNIVSGTVRGLPDLYKLLGE